MKSGFSRRILTVMDPPLPMLSAKLQQLEDGISFGQGTPFFLPPNEALQEFQHALSEDPSLHRYSLDEGLPEVRKMVAHLLREKNIDASWHEVLMTSGANEACYISILTCCDPGEGAIILTPYYFNHYMDLQLAGLNPILVKTTQDWQLNIDAIEESIVARSVKLIILNSPNNPTGAVYSEKTLRRIVDLCFEHDLYLISDETYDHFLYEDAKHFSPAQVSTDAKERVITIGSFSKALGMPGWRLGFLHASESFVNQALKAHDSIAICSPRPAQVLFKFAYPYFEEFIRSQVKKLAESRSALLQRLSQLNDVFEVVPTKGAFYMFPKIVAERWKGKDVAFVNYLLERVHVLMIPGSYFGDPEATHVRVSFGNVPVKVIHEAFDRLEAIF